MTYSRLSGEDDIDSPEGIDFDSRTPLDKTIDRIGMGASSYLSTSSFVILMTFL